MSKKSKQNTKNTIYQGKTIIPDVTAVVTATLTKQGIIRLRGKSPHIFSIACFCVIASISLY